MKILKIELQNINSLKSDTPIVIDFESSHFQDIGLYAITGSTGAGKTTILDAVTIALYQSVPRFNKSNIKAGLEDVVSYGAEGALARVVFESNGERFESQWNMRLTTKSGKRLNHPKEEVRLKNLSTEKIIAEKKRELQLEIERITHLTYHQFLRSVMLAQGEFAAFLSAGAKDKGTLLEQITGEEIYKKIGEAINNRIYVERKTLDTIKSKINTEDLLSDEKRKELRFEQKELSGKIAELDTSLKQIERIINWYKTNDELLKSKHQLEKELEGLEKEKAENRSIILALQLHEKAEPYKELINEINRGEKNVSDKKNRLEGLTKELLLVNEKLQNSEQKLSSSKKDHTHKEGELKLWMPKLEQVTGFDRDIRNADQAKEKLIRAVDELSGSIKNILKKIEENDRKKEQQINTLKGITEFLKENKNAPEIEKQLTDWSSKLTLRKNYHERISAETIAINQKEKNIAETKTTLANSEIKYKLESEKLEGLKAEIENIIKRLGENKLSALLTNQKQLETEKSKWKELHLLATDYLGFNKNKEKLSIEVKGFKANRKTLIEKLEAQKSAIVSAEQALQDAGAILMLERKIEGFEEERKKLEEGKPCNLCGSVEHPFVDHYKEIEISKSQQEVENRRKFLDNLKKEEKGFEDNILIITTKSENNLLQSNTLVENLKATKNKFNALVPVCPINELETIIETIAGLNKKLEALSGDISETQKLQLQKDEKSELLKNQTGQLNKLEIDISKFKEKAKTLDTTQKEEIEELKELSLKFEKIESTLKIGFSEFGLLMPTIGTTDTFIGQLKTNILSFQTKSKELVTVENGISQLTMDTKNTKDQWLEKSKEKEKFQKDAAEQKDILLTLMENRNAILPTGISTNEKRGALQKDLDDASKKYEVALGITQQLKTQKATKEKEKENTVNEVLVISKRLKDDLLFLEDKVLKSDFDSRSAIEKALLSYQDKTKYVSVQKQLADKELELKTLENNIREGFEKQEIEKDFELLNEGALDKQREIKLSKENLQERTGEIRKQFELDDQIKKRNQGVIAEITEQEKVLKKWTDLLTLLGGSKHAFNTYVQRLTLQNLIHLANVHLYKLNKRYSLKMNTTYKPGEELNFVLVDHYQTSEARPVDTSSGGEKFLISLALALGLSDLASNNVHIGSLFIDEGFGTLDNNSLETVISTLETLQAQGKMIGVISHVENLKERIPTQIQVLKKSNGVSEVVIV